ncbi:mitochondrial inner membrane protein OXA1L isoform X2 [Anoplophora glabripennis]|uniref:mitochondrial inner membrane protein OXA1L isoform X2 n=1 Tax=Anoplophora glabripennis TaxID=217634 RepID=UPI000874A2D3|nr:mitochondrial inner membrane protein OXA1L isoform X2 [Anoplophora glabripennis]
MSRFCSIVKYKGYKNVLKNIKVDFKTFKNSEKVEKLLNDVRYREPHVLDKIKTRISKIGIKLQENNATLSSFQNVVEEKKSTSSVNKCIRPRYVKKAAEKLCARLQRFANEKTLILATAGISVVDTANTTKNIEPIPEPPPVPDLSEQIASQINVLGEPTFASLGLGGSSPVGLVQTCFEYVHVTLGVPWWTSIAIGTLIIRLCLFPLVIIAQRNAAKMNNYLPQLQALQLKMTEARQTGNQIDAARYSQEMMLFMKEKELNPLKNMIVPLVQAPIFISFFMGLRQMCNAPVESLRTGGLWWFTDLTLPDQYFLLPIITSATLYATIELGTDSAKLSSQNMQLMKYVLRGLPLLILPFTFNFPGAILMYWVSSNFISLIQVGVLRIPAVRDYFKIEPLQKFNPENLPIKPKGFREGLKDSWTNIKITKELEERTRLDDIQFHRAGRGPIVKTYKYNPTKQTHPTKSAPISAKKRE